jgi:Ca2+:H+ antiporter
MGCCKVPALIQAQVEMGLVNDVEHKSLFRRDTDSPERKAASLMEQGSLSASFRECSTKTPNNSVLQSFKIVILSNKLNLLLPFGPLAILLHYLTDNKGWIFLLSLVGITPLAERLGYATEQLACYTGSTGMTWFLLIAILLRVYFVFS